MTTSEIQSAVQKWLYDKNHHYQALNYGKTGYFEADVLGITLSRMVSEVEVKVSMSDFKADFKKTAKHLRLSFPKMSDLGLHMHIPNRFYYACPSNLIPVSKIPGYAGLIYVDDSGLVELIKIAPILHRLKAPDKLMIGMLSNLTAKSIWGCQKMTHDARERKAYFEKQH